MMKNTTITGTLAIMTMLSGLLACGADDGGNPATGGGGEGGVATGGGGTTAMVGGGGSGGQVQTVEITTGWLDAGTQEPVEGLTVEVYAADDLDTVLGTGTTNAEGIAVLDVTPSDALWVGHASGAGYRDTWHYADEAANEDGTLLGVFIVTEETWNVTYALSGVTPDPAAGIIGGAIPPANQMATDSAGSTVVYLDGELLPDLAATEASEAGRALALNAAGDVNVSISGPGGVASRTMRAFPGALTTGYVEAARCDPVAQDCTDPNADKCAVYLAGGPAAFVCNATLGADGLGETCTRPNGYAGDDTCAAGLYCGFWGTASPSERQCHALCQSGSDCSANEHCQVVRFDPAIGTCQPGCDPFDANACPDAGSCVVGYDVDGQPEPLCSHPGTLAIDEPCFSTEACEAGLLCAHLSDPSQPNACRPICDATHPCPNAGNCVIASTGYGYCE